MRARVKRKLVTENMRSEDDWNAMVRQQSGTVYHPVGTCKMGVATDPLAAVWARNNTREELWDALRAPMNGSSNLLGHFLDDGMHKGTEATRLPRHSC